MGKPVDAWEEVGKALGGAWLRLKEDKDKALVVFRGGPTTRHVVFEGEKSRLATPEEIASGKTATKIAMNVVVLDSACWPSVDNAYAAAWEMNVRTFKSLKSIRDKYEAEHGKDASRPGFELRTFELQRQGAKGSMQTTYSILPEDKLTESQKQSLDAIEPLDIGKLYDGAQDETPF